ncbi:hypothetical protein MO973_00410 [Paenibacillus sp. TRM 82003]|nr:hypothetical protein [Paenibacillus sp. TRM 82003]
MNDKVKEAMAAIPIPPELGERSRQGIARAAAELRPALSRRRRIRRLLAGAAASLLLLTGAAMNEQVAAAVQRALQFVPGIGMVFDEDAPGPRYVLEQPVEWEDGGRSLVVTGFVSDESMVYITVNGVNVERYESVELLTEGGERYTVERSMGSWGSSGPAALAFWHNGPLDVKGDVTLRFGTRDPIDVPLTLTKAPTYDSYEEMGPTASANGAAITAIVSRVGERGRLSLVARAPSAVRIYSYEGVHGVPQHRRMQLTDTSTGRLVELDRPMGISAPASEFFFEAPAGRSTASYTLTIPELDVSTEGDAKVALNVPEMGEGTVETALSFRLAGHPVTITALERIAADRLRIHVDLHYDEAASASLYKFRIASISHSAKYDERTGVFEYFDMPIDPERREVRVTFNDPGLVLRGPWVLNLEIPGE